MKLRNEKHPQENEQGKSRWEKRKEGLPGWLEGYDGLLSGGEFIVPLGRRDADPPAVGPGPAYGPAARLHYLEGL